MAGKQIRTHTKVRKLQRTLYQQAKKNPKWRAWSLYFDLCRCEFIEEAMSRVLRNKGGSGVDGYTVQAMEMDWEGFRDALQRELRQKTYRPSPVKRITIPKGNGGERHLGIPTVKDRVVQTLLVILLEPIFEADFHDESYGYRPGRQAVDAIKSIEKAIYYQKPIAIEADLSSYFDMIDHRRLMKLVKRRVSDGSILKLVISMLRVPVLEEGKDGKNRTLPNSGEGVPQGGVISPLLANLFLDKLDHAVNALGRYHVVMVRYADDFVVLVQDGMGEAMMRRIKDWLEKAGLQLNVAKTKITDTRKGGRIEFLGYELSERRSTNNGNRYIHVQASKKAQQRYRDKVREELHRWTTWRSTEEVITRVNRITVGWSNYFHHGNRTRVNGVMTHWLKQRVRRWLAVKHRVNLGSRFVRFPDEKLEELNLTIFPSHVIRGKR